MILFIDFKCTSGGSYKFSWQFCSFPWENSRGNWHILHFIKNYGGRLLFLTLWLGCFNSNFRQKQVMEILATMLLIPGLPSLCPPASHTWQPIASSQCTEWPSIPSSYASVRTPPGTMESTSHISWARLPDTKVLLVKLCVRCKKW